MTNLTDQLLADLTPSQLQAVTHLDGPLLILAAAGSGKTRVITRRVAWLIQNGVRSHQILAITFTNKAAGEMKQRVESLLPGNRVWISTFHALGAKLLRMYADEIGIDRNFTIFDIDDRNKIVKEALDSAGMDNFKFTPERIGGAISKAKNQLLTPEKFAQSGSDFFTNTASQVYGIYQKKLRAANGVDFDDLLYVPALVLKHNQQLREILNNRFRYILIDEYQDTNQAQYEIAKYLSLGHSNLCVVGDPDQSIYKWRGSDIKNILNFERDFPTAKTITLDKNYRSTAAILQAAGTLIENNKQRKKKALITDRQGGQPVRELTFDSGIEEATIIARRIRDAVASSGRKYRDFAIFYRMNALTRTLEQAFVREAIPFQIVKGLAFFDRKETKDILAYLRLLINPADSVSFNRIVNEPPRGVGKTSLEHLHNYAETNEITMLNAASQIDKIKAIKGKAIAGIKSFLALIRDLKEVLELPPDEVIRTILDRSGYREMLKTSGDEEDQDRLANIEELITAAQQFHHEDPSRTIQDFLENITLASDIDGMDENSDCVSMMTLHAAKGLEFPVVYMIAVEQGILPHERSMAKEDELEEERRLAFVGITRAMEELYLCRARLREFRGQALYAIQSMFLEELPNTVERIDYSAHGGRSPALDRWRTQGMPGTNPLWNAAASTVKPMSETSSASHRVVTNADATEFEVGLVVQHEQYGIGTISELSGLGALRRIKIRFAAHGEKIFVIDKVKLKVVRKK
jgi:DNA helicase II / ATP-dependent DNA helicase PcrA